jgi:hypothetical protein
MKKAYKNRQMESETGYPVPQGCNKTLFFFPKSNPPAVVCADTIEEANEILLENSK